PAPPAASRPTFSTVSSVMVTSSSHSPASSSSGPASTWAAWLPAGLLLVLVLLVYAPTLNNGFIWDDDDYVTRNETLISPDGLRRIWFELGATPQYYPLVHTSFWIEHHLCGLDPRLYHAVNMLLHATAAILLWRLLLQLEVPGAWLAAALFAVH